MSLTKKLIGKLVLCCALACFLDSNLHAQLQFTSARVTEEQAIELKWNSESNSLYRIDYADEIADTMQWKQLYELYPAQGTNTLFLDAGIYYTGNTIEHPRNFPQRFYRVVQTGTNEVAAPTVTVVTPTNGFVASGLLDISVAITSDLTIGIIHVFVDGEEVRLGGMPDATNFTINTCEWPNGPHSIFAVVDGATESGSIAVSSPILFASGVSPFKQVEFNNYISKYTFSQAWPAPSTNEPLIISAQFADYADWTLLIVDPESNTVRTATGTGFNMSYAWDGNDESNNPTLDGFYSYFLSASNSLSSPSAPSSSEENASIAPPGFEFVELMAAPADGSGSAVPFCIFPPGWDTNNLSIFEAPVQSFSSPNLESKSSRKSSETFASQSTESESQLAAPSQPQAAPQPSRPTTRRNKATSGTVGIVALNDYLPASNKPAKKFSGSVNIAATLPLPTLNPWSLQLARAFQVTMKDGQYTNGFFKTQKDLTAGDLRGSANNIFNTGIDFGLIACHGIRATAQDDNTSTPSLQTYIPFPPATSQYDWIRISDMKFGGSRLKWMGIYACDLLNTANYNDLYNKNLLPLTPNLHMFISGSTTVYLNGIFGRKFGELLTAKKDGVQTTNAPAEIWPAWVQASKDAHKYKNSQGAIPDICKMRVIYWPDCLHDTIYNYAADSGGGEDQSESAQLEEIVFDPANP